MAARSTTRLAYAPSVTSQIAFFVVPTHTASQPISSAASSSLVRNGQRYSGGMVPMSFLRTYSAARTGRPIAPQQRVPHDAGQGDPHVPVHPGLGRRPGRRVAMHPGPLDVRPVPLGHRVVQGEHGPTRRVPRDPLGGPQQDRAQRPGPPADRPEQVVGPAEVGPDPGRPEPGRGGPPLLPAQQQAEEDRPEPVAGPAVEHRGQLADEGGQRGGHRP